jgi:hypothetical protein
VFELSRTRSIPHGQMLFEAVENDDESRVQAGLPARERSRKGSRRDALVGAPYVEDGNRAANLRKQRG